MKRVLRGIETECKAHAKRLDATTRQATTRAARAARGEAGARGFDQIGRVARAEEVRRHREAMRNRAREERAAIRARENETRTALRGLAEIGRAARAEQFRQERDAIRSAERQRKAAKRAADSMARGVARGGARTLAGAGRTVVGLGSLAVGATGLAGGFAAANAVQEEIQIRAAASRLANQAGDPGLKGKLAADSKKVRGFTGTEVLGGIEEFVTKTGDLRMAQNVIGSLGTLALATGSDLGDLGATAGQVFNVLRDQIRDPKQQLTELNAIMGTLAQQGALGAVEIRDLAQDFGKLGAATRGFEGGAPELLRTMGAFAQLAVARGGAESSADASTAAARLTNDIVVNRKKFKKLDVDIQSKTDPTKLRNPMEIFADVLAATGGDVTKTAGLFGAESRKVFQGLSPIFAEAEKRKPGSGRAAIMAEFEKFATAKVSPEDLAKRAGSRLADPDLQLKESLKAFNSAVADQLLPTVTRLIPRFNEMIPTISRVVENGARLAEWFVDHPFKGIGAIIAGKIAMDLASAGIGAGVERALAAIIRRIRPGVTSPGGGTSPSGTTGGGTRRAGRAGRALAFAGGAAGAGLLGFELGTMLGEDAASATSDPRNRALDVQGDLLNNRLDRVGMRTQRNLLEEDLRKLQEGPGLLETIGGGFSSLLGGPSASEANSAAIKDVTNALAALKESIAASEASEGEGLDVSGATAQLEEGASRAGDILVAKINQATTTNPRRTSPVVAR